MNWWIQDALDMYTGEYKTALLNMAKTLGIGVTVIFFWCALLLKDFPKWEWVAVYVASVLAVYVVLLFIKISLRKRNVNVGKRNAG